MQITLDNVLPTYISREKAAHSALWCQQLELPKQCFVHIVAPSGTGKTSLIHFLYGLRNSYTGEIRYDGQPIRNFTADDFAEWRQRYLSVVFQDLRVFPEHSVWQNIDVKRQLAPFHPNSQIERMAERLGIADKLKRICKTCSYGEQQRIAIIRALQQPFDYLLLDEPFSHLDEHNRHKAMELIEEEARARNASIILADLKQLDYFHADQILYL
jgi:putative ABC transport system ATP-binding protein